MRARNTAIAMGTALALSLVGCRQVLDTTGYGTKGQAPTYTGKSDGVFYVSKSCRDCVDAECPTEAAACAADPACAAKAQCLAGCAPDNHECRGKCNLSIPDTVAMRVLVQCEATHGECGECGSGRAVLSGAGCDECMAANCARDLDAVSQDATALETLACESECRDANGSFCECPRDGESADAGQDGVLAAVVACREGGLCRAACDDKVPDWSCLRSVQWPPPAPKTTLLELDLFPVRVEDDTTPLRQFAVSACPEVGDCSTPLTTPTTTSDEGWAQLMLSRPSTGDRFFGHLVTADADLDASLYLFPPLRASPSRRKARLVSKSLAQATVTNLMPGGGRPLILDWARKGGIVWSIVACNKAPAAGVEVSVESGELPLYSGPDKLPDPKATETTSIGLGVFINVAPGQPTLTAKRRQTGQIIGTYSVQVRAGSITHVTMVPTPESG